MITDTEISRNGYSLYCKDRPAGMGDGVLLCVHESLSVTCIHILNNYDVEDSAWHSITLRVTLINMSIGLVYSSPNSSATSNDKLLHLL